LDQPNDDARGSVNRANKTGPFRGTTGVHLDRIWYNSSALARELFLIRDLKIRQGTTGTEPSTTIAAPIAA
jgi:hypothetical protein